MHAPLIVVSAANAPYARALWQLLRSAERHRAHRAARWIVYDLGLSGLQRETLAGRFAWASFREFDFERFPPHFSVQAGHFAWRSAILRDLALETDDFLLWLDSATVLKAGLDEPVRTIERHGVYAARGQASLAERCDAGILERLQVPTELRHLPERVGGVMGFDLRKPVVRRLIEDLFALTSDPAISRPVHNRPPVHKTQALWGILLYEAVWRGELTLPDVDIDISSGHPMRWMSSRNLVGNSVPTWADPLVRLRYWSYKTVDQALWRLKDFEDRRISGWYRFLREHFTVYVARAGAEPERVRAPWSSYYADPFPLHVQDRQWLLLEEFRYAHNRGRLVILALDDLLRQGPARPLDTGREHASFPFIFRCEGRVFMVPETNDRKSIDLYELDALNASVRLVRRLLFGVDASDSVLFEHAGRYWVITSQRDSRASGLNRYLAIYHFTDLEHGELQPHPVNGERRYADRGFSWGRCAGSVWLDRGDIVRPIHSSREYYGQSISWMRINALTPDSFSEEETTPPAEWPILRCSNFHHLGIDGDVLAGDLRDRVGRRQGLAALLHLAHRPMTGGATAPGH